MQYTTIRLRISYTRMAPKIHHHITRASQEEPPWQGTFKKAASFVQNLRKDLPVIGLISKLTTPTGSSTNSQMTYLEYARSIYDALDEEMNLACREIEEQCGKAAQLRFLLCICWMANRSFGEIPPKAIVQSAFRIRGSFDLEYEVQQFELLLEIERQKYGLGEKIDYTQQNVIPTVVDGLVRLVLGVKEDTGVDIKIEDVLVIIISKVFPRTDELEIRDAFQRRSARVELYV